LLCDDHKTLFDASMKAGSSEALIELRVERIGSLFDALDPFPIPSRDLGANAEDFIVSWARECPPRAPLRILVHVPAKEVDSADAGAAGAAIARHFTYRAERMRGDLHQLFRTGRVALAIGVGVLAFCMIAGRLASLGHSELGRYLSEGLIIVGWVANWRPLEIFLYDWQPIAERRRLYRRLAAAPVEVRALEAAAGGAGS
jgi:hypothetical protein